MELLKRILIKFGYRNWKPIISMYVSFNVRDIIYECSYTKERKCVRERRNYGDAFTIPTTNFIDYKTFKEVLNGSDYFRIGESVFLKSAKK
jgi:hypothetical protein